MSNSKWLAELKTVLQVAKARLDVREKKKTEQVAKERYAIADYVRNNKTPRARIAVEHIVREDYKIEAMDRLQAYIDTLLMRLQLIKDRPKNGAVDPAVEQPLANILWAAPFLAQDIPEMIQITNMFKKHFGIEYVSMCEQNKLEMVDVDLLRCLSCNHIPKLLVEKYVIEICRSQNVPFEPDPTVMAQDEFWNIGQRYVQAPPPPPLPTVPTSYDEKRPPPGGFGSNGGGGGGARLDYPNAPAYENPPPNYSTTQPKYPQFNAGPSMPHPCAPPPPPPAGPRLGFAVDTPPQVPFHDPFPAVPRVPMMPPAGQDNSNENDGFDDLARRFEELRKRK